jgi:hypothetical protein
MTPANPVTGIINAKTSRLSMDLLRFLHVASANESRRPARRDQQHQRRFTTETAKLKQDDKTAID